MKKEEIAGQHLSSVELTLLGTGDAIYHQAFNVNFRTGKAPPIDYKVDDIRAPQKFRGRPNDLQSEEAFCERLR